MRLATDYCVSTPTASGSILLLPFSIVPMRRTPQFCAERIRSGKDGGPLPTEGHVSRHLLAHGERPMPVGRDARERTQGALVAMIKVLEHNDIAAWRERFVRALSAT